MAMVSGVLSLSRNGLRDWIIQRVSSVVLALYFVYLMFYFFTHPELMYVQWVSLFQHSWFRLFTIFALLSLVLHAWVGVWTVTTDYIKPLWLRASTQILVIMGLVLCFLAGIEIIWGFY